jgi:hypothetical protein
MGMTLRSLYSAGLAFALAVPGMPAFAHASVAVCGPSLSGEAADDASEMLARKQALASWVGHASRLGAQYTRWGIAWNRRIECKQLNAGVFSCRASGQPCAIHHVPPEGTTPLRRGTDG